MTVYVLPTGIIIKEFASYESMFCFYQDGIRGIVKDAVITSAAWKLKRYPESLENCKQITTTGLIEKILRDYVNSPEAVGLKYTENTDSETYIELIAEMIDNAVSEMMSALFAKIEYDVSKTQCRWLGNDLIALIKIIDLSTIQ